MMTIPDRETAYLALFNWLQVSQYTSGIKTFTRKLKHWNDVANEDQPALYMSQTGEMAKPILGLPPAIVLECDLYLYVQTNGEEVGPIINPILDAIGNALTPPQGADNKQTLGGLVHHCWIEGQTQIFEGNLGDEAVATIPVKMLVT